MDLEEYAEDASRERPLKVPRGLSRKLFLAKKIRTKVFKENISNPEEEEEEDFTAERVHSIQIGENHQADIEEWIGSEQDDDTQDRDVCIWRPPDSEIRKHAFVGTLISNQRKTEELEDMFYEAIEILVWRTTWRQFDGHITFEIALLKLMECGYSFCRFLNSVEECLEILPQRMKPLTIGQAEMLFKSLGNNQKSMRELQKTIMPQYHLGEIRPYIIQFCRYYNKTGRILVPCNCDSFLCYDQTFEPRYGCKNCTKHLKDTTEYKSDQLCLLCLTYEEITGESRQTKDILWDQEEAHLIEQWKRLESEMKKKIGREELLEILQHERIQRLTVDGVTDEDLNSLGSNHLGNSKKELIRKLQPFILPHFVKCQCEKNIRFTENEVRRYREAIINSNGRVREASNKLKVEVKLFFRFLEIYGPEHPIWKDCDNHEWREHEREVLPSTVNPLPDLMRPVKAKEGRKLKEPLKIQVNRLGETYPFLMWT
uniref:ELM2 domain-containing protein n=1 Tax=Caenorhabditis tropicalis TaxID=1561998 RepID=A0A1I7U0B6_9PELO